jgi:hypothetical protein
MASLEATIRDLDGMERLSLARLQKAGWRFTSIGQARQWLSRHRAAERVTAESTALMQQLLSEAAGWQRRDG